MRGKIEEERDVLASPGLVPALKMSAGDDKRTWPFNSGLCTAIAHGERRNKNDRKVMMIFFMRTEPRKTFNKAKIHLLDGTGKGVYYFSFTMLHGKRLFKIVAMDFNE
jgi:hypothetical protein